MSACQEILIAVKTQLGTNIDKGILIFKKQIVIIFKRTFL
jgi:hypothetical protein